MIDYQVRLIKFPPGKAYEAVTLNEDGSYTIFIDRALSREGQQQKFLHALKHILKNDFEKENASLIEHDIRNANCGF